MGLVPCSTCQRHVRAEDKACPFCGARAPISGVAGLAAAAALALAGCGGKAASPAQPPGNEGEDEAGAPDAGVDQPPPPDDPIDRGGDVQPLYGVDINRP